MNLPPPALLGSGLKVSIQNIFRTKAICFQFTYIIFQNFALIIELVISNHCAGIFSKTTHSRRMIADSKKSNFIGNHLTHFNLMIN